MSEAGHMNYFGVEHCGLYKTGSETIHGCDLNETFDLIAEWVGNRPLSQTIPWDPSSSRKAKPKCYCKDIYKDMATGDFFVVLWKSDTDSAGAIWGAKEDEQTGAGEPIKFTNSYRGKKVVWGRPCYYWVVPKLNLVISIKFEHSITDAKLFSEYVKGCINNRVYHPNRKKERTETGQTRLSYVGDEGNRFSYRFDMHLKSLNTSSSELQKLVSNVTHIVRRETILVNSKDERAEWVRIFDKIPYVSSNPKSNKRKIEVNAEAKPTLAEVKKIIEENAEEQRNTGDWDNVGFKTNNGVTWVDKFRLTSSINMPDKEETIYTAKEICGNILNDRRQLLSPILRDIEGNKSQVNKEELAETGNA